LGALPYECLDYSEGVVGCLLLLSSLVRVFLISHFPYFPFFLFYTSYDREVCVGGVASEEHVAGADRMGSLFEDTLHIYGGISGNFYDICLLCVSVLSFLWVCWLFLGRSESYLHSYLSTA
jgi:hypothetical protein